jgi:hypothetical protein
MTDELMERVLFLENLLKSNGVHEFTCNVAKVTRHNSRGQTYMYPQPCNCWLMDGVDESNLRSEVYDR